MKNESEFLTKQYKGCTWDDISKCFLHSDVLSHTVHFNSEIYFVVCDRLDRCIRFTLMRQ